MIQAYYRWLYERVENYVGQKVLVAGPACDQLCEALQSKKVCQSFQLDLSDTQSLKFSQFNFDTVLCINALERSASDSVALQNIHKLLVPEGTAIFLVPALPWLSQWLDSSNAVRHRYGKKQIFGKLDQHRFHVVHCFYYNSLGMLFPHHRTNLQRNSVTDKLAGLWNRWEKKFNFPIGRSLVVIAKTKLPARG